MLHQSKHTPQRPLSEKQKDSTQVTSSSGGGGGGERGAGGGGTYTRSHRTCDWEDVLINKVLFRGKGEKNNSRKKACNNVHSTTTTRNLRGCRKGCFFFFSGSTTRHTYLKLAERDFHFLFRPRGGEGGRSRVNFLITHRLRTHVSEGTKWHSCQRLKALWLAKIKRDAS